MRKTLFWLAACLVSGFKEQRELALENLALRQQLAVLQRSAPRLQLQCKDRFFWIWLSQVWEHWREALILVKPETVVGWHRRGFCLFWRWVSRRNPAGRPGTSPQIRELIRKMAADGVGTGRTFLACTGRVSLSLSPNEA